MPLYLDGNLPLLQEDDENYIKCTNNLYLTYSLSTDTFLNKVQFLAIYNRIVKLAHPDLDAKIPIEQALFYFTSELELAEGIVLERYSPLVNHALDITDHNSIALFEVEPSHHSGNPLNTRVESTVTLSPNIGSPTEAVEEEMVTNRSLPYAINPVIEVHGTFASRLKSFFCCAKQENHKIHPIQQGNEHIDLSI